MLRILFLLLLIVLNWSALNAGTHNYYIPSNFSISGNGSFCETAGTTLLSSTVTYNATPCSSNSGSGNSNNYATLSYQWYTDTDATLGGGTPIAGATASTYSAPINAAGTFYYYCTLTWTDPDGGGACTGGSILAGNVTITVSAPPTVAAAGADFTTGGCVTTATLAGNTPTTGTGTWTIVTGPGAITTPSSPTSGVTGLQAGVATTFRWTISNSPCTSSSDDVVITGGACASPDICSGATPVTCNNSYTGTTVGMTTETGLPCVGASAPGVWYVLAGTGGSVTADLCTGTSYDSRIEVFSGANCTSLSCVTSNDDFCGLQSQVTFSTTVGTNYYILVNGYSSNTGAFTLTLTCCTGTIPGCATSPSPANSATSVNTCTALSWTAPAAGACSPATSYDVYFGTTNPPPYLTNVATTSYTPSLAGNTTYYWEIRPRNASGPAASCTVWSFTTTPNPQYNIVDAATSAAPYNCVTLTPAVNDKRGCAWDQNSTLAFASNFSYDFTINLGNNNGGADGIAFVIQNDPLGRCKCGATGDQLGAGGIINSLIIEVDTYLNYDDRDDGLPTVVCSGGPDPDHMDLWINGNVNPSGSASGCSPAGARIIPAAIPLLNGGADYDIENGLDHILRISWNAGSSTLTAQVMNLAATVTYGTINYTFTPMAVFGTNTPYFGFTASTGGLNNQQSFCLPATLLPVEMSAFDLTCEEDHVTLSWTTNSENNNDHFTIESSSDGSGFQIEAIVDGAGTTSQSTQYSWSDENRNDQLKYYRLSQTDYDGKVKELNTVASNCAEQGGISILSMTEENGQLVLKLDNKVKADHVIELIEMSGKIIYSSSKYLENGSHTLYLDTTLPDAGIYLIRIGNNNETVVKKVGLF